MVRKVFAGISLVVSLLVLIALVCLSIGMVEYYHDIRTSPNMSGIDYLGLLIYPVLYCFAAVPGLISSAISWRLASHKAVKIVSVVLMTLFLVVLLVFGAIWLS